MGVYHWYACLDCKRYIELGKSMYPVLPKGYDYLLDWDDIREFKNWIEVWDTKFGTGVDMTFVEDVLGWFVKHWGHRIMKACDAAENEPWREYVNGWYVGDKEGWEEEVRTEFEDEARYSKEGYRLWK